MLRLLLCGWLALAAPSLGAQDGPKEKIKEAGKAVGHAGVQVGHAVRDGARAVGHAVKKGVHKTGEGVKQGVKKVGGAAGKKDD
ncbi:MAG: hypothetical protein P4L36_06105 [Holophaga sp.]|nr:hypothetical protein [Holophaga sp.]